VHSVSTTQAYSAGENLSSGNRSFVDLAIDRCFVY